MTTDARRTQPAPEALASATVPALEIAGLSVAYEVRGTWQRAVHDVSLSVPAGEVVALVGESGSGKTTIARAVVGLHADSYRIEQGTVRLAGTDITSWTQRQRDVVRGAVVSLIPQDPGSALDPVQTIGDQVAEVLQVHRWGSSAAIRDRVIELLEEVGLPNPVTCARQYPHELSGGMKQRVLIAIALALRPALVVADESTSALDVTTQQRILNVIDRLRREHGTAVLLITHDLAIAADRASRVVVLRSGRVEEAGETIEVLAAPRTAYARQLLADAPALNQSVRATNGSATPQPDGDATSIEVEQLVHDYSVRYGNGRFRAVDGVSFRVVRGTTHALVGGSGSGKTTIARDIVGLGTATSGRIVVEGSEVSPLRGDARRAFRRRVQLVYQDPSSSLDPRQAVADIIEEPLWNFERVAPSVRSARVCDVLDRVGLPSAVLQRRPSALSGGQRQRVALARALILEPRVLVLDEAVSALDVTAQAQILTLLEDLQRQLQLTYLFVSHDLAVVRQIAHTVSVLCAGRQVDCGPTEDVFSRPVSDYTRELIAAIPGRRHAWRDSNHHDDDANHTGFLQPAS